MNLTFERLAAGLQKREPKKLVIAGFAASAVLAPVIERDNGKLSLLFIERPDEAPTHSGQISFPGGVCKEGEGVIEAALREAGEELGIAGPSVEILGKLDDVATPIGFVITPVVGRLKNPTPFRAEPREVKTYFEVPLSELADAKNFVHRGEHSAGGRRYPLPEYHVAGRIIWGATARMVQNLLEIWKANRDFPAANSL